MNENPEYSSDPDEVANRMFGHPYSHLSSWGQATVDHAIGSVFGFRSKVDTPHNVTLGTTQGSLLAENERLARIIETLQAENAELWQENEQLLLNRSDSSS